MPEGGPESVIVRSRALSEVGQCPKSGTVSSCYWIVVTSGNRGVSGRPAGYHRTEAGTFKPSWVVSHMLIYVALAVVGVIILVAVLIAFWGIAIYNQLVTLRNRYKNSFSQIDVQLNRRYDLIPNLVETAKGYMAHERETLEAVIAARNSAHQAEKQAAANPGDPTSMKNLAAAEGTLGGALSRLMMVVESYPELKANQNMMALQEELTSTENKVSFARQGYNDAVMHYNTKRETFPDNLIANTFGFLEAQLFELENPKARQAPQVKF